MKSAEEYLKEQYSDINSWKVYPPSERLVAQWLESYADLQLKKEIRDIRFKVKDMILTIHSNGVDMKIITKQLDEIFPNKKI